jgi:pimeloyl-ACP methyl ester carboxylesterase
MKTPSFRTRALILLGVPALLVGGLLLVPIQRAPFMHEIPVQPLSYDAAVEEIRREIRDTPPNIAEEARTILLDHGRPTGRVYVLMHGLSNNPQQFLQFGRQLFARGHNVLIPRLPYHGDRDTMTEEWARLSEKDVLETANRSVDLARALGSEVTAAGLSLNGTACAWLAQNRSDLHRAVIMAPFLAPAGFPLWAARPVERAILRLPNMFFWWDPRLRDNLPRPPFVYPRFPTHVIGETMRLGSEVYDQARKSPPACGAILVVTTASDAAVSNVFTERLVTAWKEKKPAAVETYQFPRSENVPHDFIDPRQANQQVALVYPRLMKLLEGEGAASSGGGE